jgi:hypothetical protein
MNNYKPIVSTSSGSMQVYENVFSSQSLELTQLSNFSVDAFKLEFLMMRSATDADMNNYRSISVLPSLSKLFEKNSLCTDL